MVLTHPQQTSKAEYRISNLTGELIDHQVLNAADFLAVRAINRRAFDLVTGNQ
jgi:hypothetical protein